MVREWTKRRWQLQTTLWLIVVLLLGATDARPIGLPGGQATLSPAPGLQLLGRPPAVQLTVGEISQLPRFPISGVTFTSRAVANPGSVALQVPPPGLSGQPLQQSSLQYSMSVGWDVLQVTIVAADQPLYLNQQRVAPGHTSTPIILNGQVTILSVIATTSQDVALRTYVIYVSRPSAPPGLALPSAPPTGGLVSSSSPPVVILPGAPPAPGASSATLAPTPTKKPRAPRPSSPLAPPTTPTSTQPTSQTGAPSAGSSSNTTPSPSAPVPSPTVSAGTGAAPGATPSSNPGSTPTSTPASTSGSGAGAGSPGATAGPAGSGSTPSGSPATGGTGGNGSPSSSGSPIVTASPSGPPLASGSGAPATPGGGSSTPGSQSSGGTGSSSGGTGSPSGTASPSPPSSSSSPAGGTVSSGQGSGGATGPPGPSEGGSSNGGSASPGSGSGSGGAPNSGGGSGSSPSSGSGGSGSPGSGGSGTGPPSSSGSGSGAGGSSSSTSAPSVPTSPTTSPATPAATPSGSGQAPASPAPSSTPSSGAAPGTSAGQGGSASGGAGGSGGGSTTPAPTASNAPGSTGSGGSGSPGSNSGQPAVSPPSGSGGGTNSPASGGSDGPGSSNGGATNSPQEGGNAPPASPVGGGGATPAGSSPPAGNSGESSPPAPSTQPPSTNAPSSDNPTPAPSTPDAHPTEPPTDGNGGGDAGGDSPPSDGPATSPIGSPSDPSICVGGDCGPAAPGLLTVAGVAFDSYLQSCAVFVDLNGNQQQDADEPSGMTDLFGQFNMSTAAYAPLVLSAGGQCTDAATGVLLPGHLRAPAQASVITPLTTIMLHVAEQQGAGAAPNMAAAERIVAAGLGLNLSSALTLSGTDVIAAVLANQDTAAAWAVVQNTRLQNAVAMAAALLSAGGDRATAANWMFRSLADSIGQRNGTETAAGPSDGTAPTANQVESESNGTSGGGGDAGSGTAGVQLRRLLGLLLEASPEGSIGSLGLAGALRGSEERLDVDCGTGEDGSQKPHCAGHASLDLVAVGEDGEWGSEARMVLGVARDRAVGPRGIPGLRWTARGEDRRRLLQSAGERQNATLPTATLLTDPALLGAVLEAAYQSLVAAQLGSIDPGLATNNTIVVPMTLSSDTFAVAASAMGVANGAMDAPLADFVRLDSVGSSNRSSAIEFLNEIWRRSKVAQSGFADVLVQLGSGAINITQAAAALSPASFDTSLANTTVTMPAGGQQATLQAQFAAPPPSAVIDLTPSTLAAKSHRAPWVWIVIAVAAGVGMVLLCCCCGGVAWYCHKKRKNRHAGPHDPEHGLSVSPRRWPWSPPPSVPPPDSPPLSPPNPDSPTSSSMDPPLSPGAVLRSHSIAQLSSPHFVPADAAAEGPAREAPLLEQEGLLETTVSTPQSGSTSDSESLV